MALELTGDDIVERQAGLGNEEFTSESVMGSRTVTVEGKGISHMPIPVDIIQNANEVGKGEDKANSDFLKDAREVWPTQQKVHSFYFPKYRSFEDAKLKAKVEEAQKDIQKKTNARLQIIEKLKAKRSERALVISELRPLSIKDKEYKSAMGMKRKEMEPLQAALGELRSANNAAREKGMGLCSSEEELNDTIRSLNYRIQHESLTLNEEKRLIKELKQLEGTREKVIANATTRIKIQDSLGQKEAIRGQVKLITGDIDEVRKEQQSVRTEIKGLELKLEAIDDAISSLQKELDALAQKKNNAYDILNELRQSNNDVNASYFENRTLLNNAKVLAAKKDLTSLQGLHNSEIENFMSQWSSSSIFREDYEKRILTSLDIRQLSRDGRMRNPDEKPIIVKAPAVSKEPEAAPAKVGKQAKETIQLPLQHDVPLKTQDDNLKKSKAGEAVGKTANSEDISNAPLPKKKPVKEPLKSDDDDAAELPKLESEKKPSKLVEIDEEKLKEIRREEQAAKAKLAQERKKKLAEKAAMKAAARAEKEAEKKLKEKEKKARKKTGEPLAPVSAEETDSSAIVTEQEEESIENVEEVNVPIVQKSKELKDKLRIRNRPRGREPVPKVMLKKKKANSSYWLWAGPAAVAAAALVILGYYVFIRNAL